MGRKREQEEEIRELIRHGLTPQEIIQYGYKENTVYKVYKEFIEQQMLEPTPTWTITNLTFNKPKPEYQVGEEAVVSFGFKNISRYDIFLQTIVIYPSWLAHSNNNSSSIYSEPPVYGYEVRDLIKPEAVIDFTFRFPIPDINEREYPLMVYADIQYPQESLVFHEAQTIGTIKVKNPWKPPVFYIPDASE